MGKCIGGIAHDAVGLLATYKPSKSFGEQYYIEEARKSGNAVDQINGISPRKANKNGNEAAFANPENNKTGILDDNLSKKSH